MRKRRRGEVTLRAIAWLIVSIPNFMNAGDENMADWQRITSGLAGAAAAVFFVLAIYRPEPSNPPAAPLT